MENTTQQTAQAANEQAAVDKRDYIRWLADDWQKFSDACYAIIKPLVDAGKPTSFDINGVIESAQESAIKPESWRTVEAIRSSTPFIRYFNRFGFSPETCNLLVSKRVSRLDINMDNGPSLFDQGALDQRRTKWSTETMRSVADEYLKLSNENPALNRYDVLQLAMSNVLPEELHRNKYSAWASLTKSGILVGTSRLRSSRTQQPAAPQIAQPGGVEVCMSHQDHKPRDTSVPTLEQIESSVSSAVEASLTTALQPILLKLTELHTRIDSVGRQAGLCINLGKDSLEGLSQVSMQVGLIGSNTNMLLQNLESANGRLTRIIKRLRQIGPDEEWENDVRQMLENVLGKVADIEELVLEGRDD